jgi:hypothetical protein
MKEKRKKKESNEKRKKPLLGIKNEQERKEERKERKKVELYIIFFSTLNFETILFENLYLLCLLPLHFIFHFNNCKWIPYLSLYNFLCFCKYL